MREPSSACASDRGSAIHRLYRPRPPLDRLVHCLWVSADYVSPTARERVLPTGTQSLIVPLAQRSPRIYADEHAADGMVAGGAVVCGSRSRPLIIDSAFGPTVGVQFKPGGARPFFDVPADAIAEQTVSLDALWGAAARRLRERLVETAAPLERLRVLEAALLERVRLPFELDPALRISLAAFEERGLPSVAEVNRRTGLSPRRLLALFREQVGLNPKTFWRVRRFRAALRDLDDGVARGARLAYEHGYFDQAHFLREFRAMTGASPREYLAMRIAGSDHVAVRP